MLKKSVIQRIWEGGRGGPGRSLYLSQKGAMCSSYRKKVFWYANWITGMKNNSLKMLATRNL